MEVMNIKEAVTYLNGTISEWLLRREINAGNIPSCRIGKRILLEKSALSTWVEDQLKKSIEPKEPCRLSRAK